MYFRHNFCKFAVGLKNLTAFRYRFYLFALALLSAIPLNAQISVISDGSSTEKADSTQKVKVKRSDPQSRFFAEWMAGKDTFYKWDSTFEYVHRYNPGTRGVLPYADLGIIGTPSRLLWIDPFNQAGFQSGFNPFGLYNKDPDKMQFYKAAVPFTKFNYVQGGNGVFIFNALHSQNFSKTWNVTIDFSSIQNGEIYTASNQGNSHKGLVLGSHFTNKRGNYSNVLIGGWNRAKRNENFGLKNGRDTSFFKPIGNNLYSDPSYYPANGTANSAYGTHHHVFMQKLFLDTNKNLYIFHKIESKKEKYVFNETEKFPDSSIYGSKYFFDSSSFKDSVAWSQLKNEIGLGNSISRNSKFPMLWKLSASANRVVYNSIYKTAANIDFNQGVHAILQWNPYYIQKINAQFTGDYFIAGMNAGDYKLQGLVGFNAKLIYVSAGIKSQAYTAPLFNQIFTSNYKQFTNTLAKVRANAIFGNLIFKNSWIKIHANFNSGTIDNFIYTNEKAEFKQTSGMAYLNLQGGINIRLGKFYIDNQFSFQSHNKQNIIPLPKYSDYLSLYFQGYLFKKAMLARMGADFWIMGAYNGYNYNPEMAVFTPSQISAGNYPVGDIFFSGEIKTVQLFFKLEHLNQRFRNYGFNNYSYSAIPYPMEPFRLRIGLNWKFYN